jgi:ferredoxin-NADP reductase
VQVSAASLFALILAAVVLQILIGAIAAARRRHPEADETSPAKAPRGAATVLIAPSDIPTEVPAQAGTSPAWRQLRVVGRALEDAAGTQCSFTLAAADGAPLPPWVAGQYIIVEVPLGAGGVALRCYSLSGPPSTERYRITVKRAGSASTALHDTLQVGDGLRVGPPAGRFVFEPDPGALTVLVAGGIGVTPLLAMLHGGALLDGRPAVLYYGVRDHRELAFRAELEALRRAAPQLRVHVVYSAPVAEAPPSAAPDSVGLLDIDLLRRTLPAGRHRFYVCGPPAMMATLLPALRAWGVAPADLRAEAFGPAAAPARSAAPTRSDAQPVTFRRSGRTLTWDGSQSILALAEGAGLALASSCREGSCGVCEVGLRSGAVCYPSPTVYLPAPGNCLPCVARPTSPIELDA